MPIYEYRCKDCHQVFEEWCKRVEEDDATHACPICKGQAVRLISNTSFALKGGGWYVTDYGPRSAHKGAEGSTCSSGEAAGSDKPTTATATAETPAPASVSS